MAAPTWTTRLIDAPAEDLLTAEQTAKLLGISRETLDRMVADGVMPEPLRVGRQACVWDWRALAYYRLRIEMVPRLRGRAGKGQERPATDEDE